MALVTGGSRGLGREMALAFADAGADVVVASRKLENCRRWPPRSRRKGGGPWPTPATSGTGTSSTALAEAAYGRFGRVDVLVNNAGMSLLYGDVTEVTEAMWDKVVDLNLKGVFRLTRPGGVADGRRRRRVDHQRVEHAGRSARRRSSSPTRRPRPG